MLESYSSLITERKRKSREKDEVVAIDDEERANEWWRDDESMGMVTREWVKGTDKCTAVIAD